MIIKIMDITAMNDLTIVKFTGNLGDGTGVWKGAAPRINGSYAVELDIEEDLVLGQNLFELSESDVQPGIAATDGMTIRGVVESINEDGGIAIRIGDSLLLCHVKGKLPSSGAGVVLHVLSVALYDYDI